MENILKKSINYQFIWLYVILVIKSNEIRLQLSNFKQSVKKYLIQDWHSTDSDK